MVRPFHNEHLLKSCSLITMLTSHIWTGCSSCVTSSICQQPQHSCLQLFCLTGVRRGRVLTTQELRFHTDLTLQALISLLLHGSIQHSKSELDWHRTNRSVITMEKTNQKAHLSLPDIKATPADHHQESIPLLMRSTPSPQKCNNTKICQYKSFCMMWTNLGLCRQKPSLLFSWSEHIHSGPVSTETCLGCSLPLMLRDSRSSQEPICEKRGNDSATLRDTKGREEKRKSEGMMGEEEESWWRCKSPASLILHSLCLGCPICTTEVPATVRKVSLRRLRVKNHRHMSIQLTSEDKASTDHTYHQRRMVPVLWWMAHRAVGRASAVWTSRKKKH